MAILGLLLVELNQENTAINAISALCGDLAVIMKKKAAKGHVGDKIFFPEKSSQFRASEAKDKASEAKYRRTQETHGRYKLKNKGTSQGMSMNPDFDADYGAKRSTTSVGGYKYKVDGTVRSCQPTVVHHDLKDVESLYIATPPISRRIQKEGRITVLDSPMNAADILAVSKKANDTSGSLAIVQIHVKSNSVDGRMQAQSNKLNLSTESHRRKKNRLSLDKFFAADVFYEGKDNKWTANYARLNVCLDLEFSSGLRVTRTVEGGNKDLIDKHGNFVEKLSRNDKEVLLTHLTAIKRNVSPKEQM
eukprot:GHVP01048688.1.p1 GENE.GHVP01048688.1~~GHVP01048688.1.p1  ORF type:complete len:305 (-),score=55.68 GHVP01048688.1:114-1028(-)